MDECFQQLNIVKNKKKNQKVEKIKKIARKKKNRHGEGRKESVM